MAKAASASRNCRRRKASAPVGVFPEKASATRYVAEEAVANFAVRCTEKLRRQGSVCQGITVFAWTSKINENVLEQTIHDSLTLPIATNAQDEIVGAALAILRATYPKLIADGRPDRQQTWHSISKKLASSCGRSPRESSPAGSLRPDPPHQAEGALMKSHRRHQPQERLWHHKASHTRHPLPIRFETGSTCQSDSLTNINGNTEGENPMRCKISPFQKINRLHKLRK